MGIPEDAQLGGYVSHRVTRDGQVWARYVFGERMVGQLDRGPSGEWLVLPKGHDGSGPIAVCKTRRDAARCALAHPWGVA
jgi:hypothetical protein